MIPENWIQSVSLVGFPVAVAGYLLIRLESTMKELRDAVREMIVVCRACERRKP